LKQWTALTTGFTARKNAAVAKTPNVAIRLRTDLQPPEIDFRFAPER
jgi:hypothetical protein